MNTARFLLAGACNSYVPYVPCIPYVSCVGWKLRFTGILRCLLQLKPHSARTGRTVFSQLSAAVVRHKANDGVVYAIRAWLKYDTALSAVV